MTNRKAEELFTAGVAAEEAGDFDQALGSYQAAFKLDPTAVHARLRLASLLFDLRRFREAIAVARQIITRPGRVYLAHCVIGQSYHELGRLALAERFYRQSLAIKQTPFVWVLLADVLARRGQQAKAE